MIGQTIDERYHIEALLGRGGMGTVYRATDLAESRPVALKFLDLYRDKESEAALTRFHREFRVLARLDHPHIMRAFEYGSHDDTPYLVLEFLEGVTLSDEMAGGSLPRTRLLNIARQIGEALVYLHAQSIVHRDLKPGNLMLLPSGDTSQVKLMDFGLVRQADLSMQLTQEGMALGTVAYMAPEQAQGISSVDFRADLYALGVILYEMTTGRTPFIHENPVAMLMQQLTSTPPSPRQYNPDLDEPLEQLIMQLLAKEPSERMASTELLVQRLAQLADETVPTLALPTDTVLDTGRADLIPRVPLIGRESALSDLLERWTNVQAGQGQTVLLSGAAGVGKTRLLTEVGLQVRMGNGHFSSSHCREHTSLPYQPLIDVLDILLRDLPAFKREALPGELARLLPDASDDAPSEPDRADQGEARLRLFNACWDALHQAAQKQALMIAIEDMQWADPTTLELIGYLAQRAGQAPILFVLAYRPEEVETASSFTTLERELRRNKVADTITVEPLNRDQVTGFLQAALGQEKIPDWVVDNFHQATDGNPLFIEETLKALAAEGQVAEWVGQDSSQSRKLSLSGLSLQLPKNVLALAERRLQLLSEEDRSILTTAAVLGPEFPFVLLETVTKLDEDDLLDAIDRLLAARLIEELPLQDGEDRYRFAQEALRQALLNTISHRRLRVLHRRTGEAIQNLYDTSKRRYWPMLAHHFAMAGDDQNALKYFNLAGEAAARVYANAETITYYSRALDIAKQSEEYGSNEELTQLYTRLGRALELDSQFEPALAHYEEMETLAQARDDRPMELAALMAQATLYPILNPGSYQEEGEALSERALTLAQALGDQAAESKILWNLLNLYRWANRMPQAIDCGERSLALARQLNLREQMAFTLNDLSHCYSAIGRLKQTQEVLAEASDLWRELDNLPMLADSLSSACLYYTFGGEYDRALALSEEAYEISRSIDNLWGQAYSRYVVGPISWERGQPEQAIAVMEETIRQSELAGFLIPQAFTRIDLAVVYGSLGAFERGMEIARLALKVAEAEVPLVHFYVLSMLAHFHLLQDNLAEAEAAIGRAKNASWKGATAFLSQIIDLVDGELALYQGDYDRAVMVTDRVLAALRQADMRAYIPKTLYNRGQAFMALGQKDKAREYLLEARTEAEALGSRWMLWQILFALSQLESDPAEAEQLHQQAREIVQDIANNTPSDLRDSFLGLPEVRAVLA